MTLPSHLHVFLDSVLLLHVRYALACFTISCLIRCQN